MRARVIIATIALSLAAVPAAKAAPPPNDNRPAAVDLDLPDTAQGTTVDATLEAGELDQVQGVRIANSVWYRIAPDEDQILVLDLNAAGDLDAGMELLRRARSQLVLESSTLADEDGRARIVHRVQSGRTYFVRVVQRANSAPGTFRIRASVPQGPPQGPGKPIGGTSARGTVDPLGKTSDAWTKVLVPGVTYRINLSSASGRAIGGLLYAPGTRDFAGEPGLLGFRSYRLFTPGPDEGGRYSFLVTARGLGDPQRYRLSVAPTGLDDLWPGRRLRNYQRIRTSLNASRIDVVDTYRFDVGSRSAVAVHVRPRGDGPFRVHVRRASGALVAAASGEGGEAVVERTLAQGRYSVTVQGLPGFRGRYTVWRVTRALTQLRLSGAKAHALGQAVRLQLRLTPATTGAARVTIERFDPASGWHFDRLVRPRIVNGSAVVSFVPPHQGRWRARASFLGTRAAQPSETPGDFHWAVLAPLDPS